MHRRAEWGEYTLRLKSFLTDSELGRQICGKLWSPPLGILNWLMLLAVLQLNMRGDGKLSLALAPSLGIMAGLVVGTPIHYLPRYGLPIQLLLPLIILLLFAKTEKT